MMMEFGEDEKSNVDGIEIFQSGKMVCGLYIYGMCWGLR